MLSQQPGLGALLNMTVHEARKELLTLYRAALQRVDGGDLVRNWLAGHDYPICAVVAIGKAAGAMMQGAVDGLADAISAGLVIDKAGHGVPGRWAGLPIRQLESSHPLPDERSLRAGEALLRFLADQPDDMPLLFLISGGSSALVEVLRPGITLDELRRANRWLLGSGLPIDKINAVRRRLSAIKAGGLCHYLGNRPLDVLLISDVPGDDPAVIGSGMLVPATEQALPEGLPPWLEALEQRPREPVLERDDCRHHVLGTLSAALDAAAGTALDRGFAVFWHDGFVDGDAVVAAHRLVSELRDGLPGVHIWGGETTVVLPSEPGQGGRNQQLALAAARELAGEPGLFLLAAGTDGSDGPTEDAGGLVDGGTRKRAETEGFDIEDALRRCDAGSVLAASGDLIQTGPTGTNVMDIMIGLKL